MSMTTITVRRSIATRSYHANEYSAEVRRLHIAQHHLLLAYGCFSMCILYTMTTGKCTNQCTQKQSLNAWTNRQIAAKNPSCNNDSHELISFDSNSVQKEGISRCWEKCTSKSFTTTTRQFDNGRSTNEIHINYDSQLTRQLSLDYISLTL